MDELLAFWLTLLGTFWAGLLGSTHCVGMCGSFVLTLGVGSPSWRSNLLRQVVYGLGRVATYVLCGAIAGYIGLRAQQRFASFVPVQSLLAIVAGVALVLQGLASAGVFSWRRTEARGKGCGLAGAFGGLLAGPRLLDKFVAGAVNGLLPCGLSFAFLVRAAAQADMLSGALTMLVFGLGTMPLLALVGCTGTLLSLSARRHALRVAAFCVILTGALSVARGVEFWSQAKTAESTGHVVCPYCK